MLTRTVIFIPLLVLSHGLQTSDLQRLCSQTPNAIYHRSSCLVASLTTSSKPDAQQRCNKLGDGYLAFVLSQETKVVIDSNFANGVWHWIWLEQLEKIEITGGWYWLHKDGRKWKCSSDLILWHGGVEPNNLYNTQDSGVIYIGVGLGDATELDQFGHICQYRDGRQIFKRVSRGKRADDSMVSEEHHNVTIHTCGKMCAKCPVCESFAYGYSIQHCVFYWRIVDELGTLIDSDGYDLIDRL